MERRVVPNTFPGGPPPPQPQPPPPQVPYYHNNYNHQYHHHQIHHPPPPHHHVTAVGFHQFPQNGDQRFINQPQQPHFDNNNHYPVVQQQQQPPNNMIGDHTTPFPPPNGGFNSPCGSGLRKRRSQSGLSPDPTSDGGSIKLYVAPVSKTASEDDIRQVFANYGNVTEIILPKDKMTGERTAYCFVKYKKLDEATAAITGLTDQYTFPGEIAAVKVRFADAERERIGFPVVQVPDKLYVRSLNKLTTKAEVHEVFARFGVIEDIYMALDDMKISRGYAFIQFSRREMALAAINGLNGIFTMRGSDQPLTVRFADPKKPRLGEARPTFNAPPLPMQQQQFDPNWHPPQQQPYPQWGGNNVFENFASQPNHFPSQQQQQQQNTQPIPSEVHKPIQDTNPPQHFENQQTKPETVIDSNAALSEDQDDNTMMSSNECDWSEHTCPDGNKYYFHCITCESTWEKPEEYSMFEKWFEEQDPKLIENSKQVEAHRLQETTKIQELSLSTTDQENNFVHPVTCS